MNTALKKKLIKIIGIISVLLVLTVCGLYIARNSLLKISMDRRIAKAKREQGLSISYQSLELKGVSHIEMNGLAIIPEQRDTLLQLQTLRLEFNFWKLFGGHLEVKDVQLDKLKIQLIKRDSIANYDFLFQKEKKETPSKKEEYNYAKQADELLELVFDLLPENGEIRRLSVTHQRDTNLIEVKVPLLTIKNNQFLSEITDTSGIIKETEKFITGNNFDTKFDESAADDYIDAKIKLKENIMESTPIKENTNALSKVSEATKDIVKFSDELKKKARKLKPLEFN